MDRRHVHRPFCGHRETHFQLVVRVSSASPPASSSSLNGEKTEHFRNSQFKDKIQYRQLLLSPIIVTDIAMGMDALCITHILQ